jgi:hypothetical protein
MDRFLIPANSKKGALIFSLYRPIDLLIVITGAVFSLIFFFAFPGDGTLELVIKLAPGGIGVLLTTPFGNYHNVGVLLREVYLFFTRRRIYIWKGWCVRDEFDERK